MLWIILGVLFLTLIILFVYVFTHYDFRPIPQTLCGIGCCIAGLVILWITAFNLAEAFNTPKERYKNDTPISHDVKEYEITDFDIYNVTTENGEVKTYTYKVDGDKKTLTTNQGENNYVSYSASNLNEINTLTVTKNTYFDFWLFYNVSVNKYEFE